MNGKHLTCWVLTGLLLYLPLALWSGFPLWSIMLLAAGSALILQRRLLVLLAQWRKPSPPETEQQSLESEYFIQNQDFDLNKKTPCPYCRSENVAKMIYGKPALTRQIIEGLESGSIVSGGCMIHGGAPEWHCNSCKRDFGHLTFTQTSSGEEA